MGVAGVSDDALFSRLAESDETRKALRCTGQLVAPPKRAVARPGPGQVAVMARHFNLILIKEDVKGVFSWVEHVDELLNRQRGDVHQVLVFPFEAVVADIVVAIRIGFAAHVVAPYNLSLLCAQIADEAVRPVIR